jgi:DNA-binding winged helix-turn-helix (wHTH) protein/TolB-like protein
LTRGDQPLPLGGKAFDVLAMLIHHRDRVVTRAELLEHVWPDVIVEESNLTQTVSVIRKALGDGEYIATVPARGYRFVARVTDGAAPPAAEPPAPEPPAPALPPTEAPVAALLESEGRLRARPFIFATLAAALLIAAWSLAWSLAWSRGRASATARARAVVPNSVAVLPFYDRDHLGQPDRLGLDLTERVVAELTRTTQLEVRPMADVLEFSDPRDDTPAAAGRQLRAERVVSGALSRRGSVTRLALQVVRTSDGAIVASEIIEVSTADERALAARVVAALRLGNGAGDS